jgi:CRISPR/Cas system CSM-associated protein Csm2 small subunit
MKLYLASFLEPENFGPGRKICIVKSNNIDKEKYPNLFEPLIPKAEFLNQYYTDKKENQEKAAKDFEENYRNQLRKLYSEIKQEAKNSNKNIIDILPFLEGDTLLSWERKEYSNYRKTTAVLLKHLGYEVVEN